MRAEGSGDAAGEESDGPGPVTSTMSPGFGGCKQHGVQRDGGRLAERGMLYGQPVWESVEQPLGHRDGLGQPAWRVDAEQSSLVTHVGLALATARAAAAPDDRLGGHRIPGAKPGDVRANLTHDAGQTRAPE